MAERDSHDTTEQDAILAEAKKLDDQARKKNEKAEHDARVRAARTVFSEDEEGVDGTRAVRLAHPGEVTDASGQPDPYGDHVNLGDALAPNVVPLADLTPGQAHRLGLPTGKGGAVPDAGPVAPEETRDAPVAKTPESKK